MIGIQQKCSFAIPPFQRLHDSYRSVLVIEVTVEPGVWHYDYRGIYLV